MYLYIPKKIHIGFQKRADTYTGKLAFITYTDEKGLFRQENAWNGWRDKSIDVIELDNKPSKFIFNKDVTRNSHWSDVTKVRIYDQRDFEFEITVSNMIHILMHSDISKRDIQEECVFAWNGKNLTLIPVNSQQYLDSLEQTRKLNTTFSTKDLEVGHTYSIKNENRNIVYMGYFDWSEYRYYDYSNKRLESIGKKHIFKLNQSYGDKFGPFDPKKIAEKISINQDNDFANLIEDLQKTNNMIKKSSFVVKKGFDINEVGYKKNNNELLYVHIKDNGFDMGTSIVNINETKKEVMLSNTRDRYWMASSHEEKMRNLGINTANNKEVYEYFKSIGFGKVLYKE